MPILNFDEIQCDQRFEGMISHFLQKKGYSIERGPAVGPDAGKDMIAIDHQPYGNIRLLVSCKYKLSRNGSVCYDPTGRNGGDHCDINRMRQHQCNGFIYAYATSLSQPLLDHMDAVCHQENAFLSVYRGVDIERELLVNPGMFSIIQQFMPSSFAQLSGYIGNNECEHCKEYTAGNVYLLPYYHPSSQITVSTVCDYCWSYRIDENGSFGPGYGAPVAVYYESVI